jgi:tetratricopeptide (TPR) repeat protein
MLHWLRLKCIDWTLNLVALAKTAPVFHISCTFCTGILRSTRLARFWEFLYIQNELNTFIGGLVSYSLNAAKHFEPINQTMLLKNTCMKFLIVLLLMACTASAYSQSFETLLKEGDALVNQKNYATAIERYSAAIALNNTNVVALNKRANTYLVINEPDKALSDLERVLQLDPKNAAAWGNSGLAKHKKKLYKQAIDDYSESIVINPKNPWTYLSRGISEVQIARYDLALDDFDKSIELDNKRAGAYSWRGFTLAKMSQYDLAIADYSTAIQMDPDVANNYNNRGLYYNQLGEYSKSVADFEKAINLAPNSGNTYINILSPLIRLGKLNEANAYYEQYLQKGFKSYLNNDKYEFLRFYIQAFQQLLKGDNNAALAAIDKANELYGSEMKEETQRLYVDMMYLEGLILEKMNLLEDAIGVYEQSLMINYYQPDVEARLKDLDVKLSLAANLDTTAPEIIVITPASTRAELGVENTSIQIVGKAKDPSGIEYVKINGIAAEKLEEDGLFISNIKLAAGTNTWVITSSDKRGNISTKSIQVQGAAATRGTTVAGKGDGKTALVLETTPVFHAILIAEQNYDDPKIPDLKNPKNDALQLGKILQSKYGFAPENMDTLFDRSREDIMSAIVKKSSTLTENESLIIFYAGHGIAEKDKFGDVDGYWIPSSAKSGLNATYISTDDINKAIKRSNAKHILVIADACFSGAMTRALPPDAAKELTRQYVIASRKVMASGNLEPVPDNSKFIFYLKKKLEENTEKYLTAKDLFDSFYKAVLSNSETLPQYAAIKNVGDEGGEFVFIKK